MADVTATMPVPADNAPATQNGQAHAHPLPAPGGRRIPGIPNDDGIPATMLGIMPVLISVAAAISVLLYVFVVPDDWASWWKCVSPAAGILAALIAGLVYALRNGDYASPARLDPSCFGELHNRITALDARIAVLCNGTEPITCGADSEIGCKAACSEIDQQRRLIIDELKSKGTRWILGSGYVDLWTRVHDIEEALYILEPDEEIVAAAVSDGLRIKGARIGNADDFQTKLNRAISVLSPDGAAYLAIGAQPITIEDSARTPAAKAQARAVLRDIRRAIDDFRDERRSGLVRARAGLVWTGTVTALNAYGLLSVAIVAGASSSAVMAAVIFYLIAAAVGLFNQLRTDSLSNKAVEDFGLARARVFHIPVLSGLAGVGGVLITAILYGSMHGSILAYDFPPTVAATPSATAAVTTSLTEVPTQSQPGGIDASPTGAAFGAKSDFESTTPASVPTALPTATAEPTVAGTPLGITNGDVAGTVAETGSGIPSMDHIFSLRENRYGLLIAAIFGLTPGLLIDRLRTSAEEYKADMQHSTTR